MAGICTDSRHLATLTWKRSLTVRTPDSQSDNAYHIYAASGNDVGPGKLKGHLVVVDAHNGVLVSIGHTGFEEVNSLAFTREGTLYGWAKGKGLITLDTETG